MPEITLLPCPACRNDAATIEDLNNEPYRHIRREDDEYYLVRCEFCDLATGLEVSKKQAADAWNSLPRELTWTTEPKFGAWNWWRLGTFDPPSCRYVFTDGTINNYRFGRILCKELGGQWCPIPTPKESTA